MSDLFAANSEDPEFARFQSVSGRGSRSAAKLEKREVVDREEEGRPLADRLRPQTLEDYLGQHDLLGPDRPLALLMRTGKIPSLILWGPPGCGKTTLARLIAQRSGADFITLSAVTSNVRDVRSVMDTARANKKFQRGTILFVDEIHRFNKAQQDGFLPAVEAGMLTLIGATTENPSFSIIAPLLSRSRVFVLKPMTAENMLRTLQRGLEMLNGDRPAQLPIEFSEDAFQSIIGMSDGDARRALGLLEVATNVQRARENPGAVTTDDIAAASQRTLIYDKTGEEHYNLISALHKTLRSSDPHAAVYWLGRMIASGEDPLFIARRLIRFASEDIGLADSNALLLAMEGMRAYQMLGAPEGELALAQVVTYLAMAPKSNAMYESWKEVRAEVAKTGSLPVPLQTAVVLPGGVAPRPHVARFVGMLRDAMAGMRLELSRNHEHPKDGPA